MNSDETPKTKKFIKYRLSRWVIGIGVVYLFVESVWKMSFVWGIFKGIYWLFVFADDVFLQLIKSTLGLSALLLLVYIVMAIARRGNREIVGELSLAFFICSLLIAPTVLITFAQHTVHLETKRINNRVYYLADYPMFDDNYALYECDLLGVFCKRVYRSGDYSAGVHADLIYYEQDNELAIDIKGEGEIYRYGLP